MRPRDVIGWDQEERVLIAAYCQLEAEEMRREGSSQPPPRTGGSRTEVQRTQYVVKPQKVR